MKTCTGCHTEQPLSAFHRQAKGKYGVTSRCKSCEQARRRQRYLNNKERENQQSRAWAAENPAASRRHWRDSQARRRKADPLVALIRESSTRARKAGIEHTLTREDLEMPTHCPVLGIPLVLGEVHGQPNSPSLDRLDPSGGYTPDNVRVISWRANRLKSDATPEELEAVLAYMIAGGLTLG